MEALPWFWIWIVLCAVLCVGEMLTASFFMLPFAVGSGVAAIANALGAPLGLQFALLIVVSILALAALRPLANRITKNNTEKAGAERLVGSFGEVIGSAGGPNARDGKREFRVLVERDEWNAVCADGTVLSAGTEVEVLKVEGAHLIVRPREEKGI
jgi:membrane protein implicated in regulation of membrane protease activity